MLIELSEAEFGYGAKPVVRVHSLQLNAGQCLGIFGPNGSGKTTLVRGLAGLTPPIAGHVKRYIKLHIGYLPQHRTMELHWPMTGLDAAAMASSARRRFGWLGGAKASVLRRMRVLHVEDLADQPFAELSGGQQQRLLLAGALAADPHVLILDEPTDGLDLRSRRALLEALREAVAQRLACVIISHDVEDLMLLCHEVAFLHPAGDSDQPSEAEIILTAQLTERLVHPMHGP